MNQEEIDKINDEINDEIQCLMITASTLMTLDLQPIILDQLFKEIAIQISKKSNSIINI